MKIYLTIFIFFLIACSPKKNEVQVLQADAMEQVLWDVMRADEFAMNYLNRDSIVTLKDQQLKLYEKAFIINHTTYAVFKKSLTYYQQHPRLLKTILDSLESRVNKENMAVQQSYSGDTLPPQKIQQLKPE